MDHAVPSLDTTRKRRHMHGSGTVRHERRCRKRRSVLRFWSSSRFRFPASFPLIPYLFCHSLDIPSPSLSLHVKCLSPDCLLDGRIGQSEAGKAGGKREKDLRMEMHHPLLQSPAFGVTSGPQIHVSSPSIPCTRPRKTTCIHRLSRWPVHLHPFSCIVRVSGFECRKSGS